MIQTGQLVVLQQNKTKWVLKLIQEIKAISYLNRLQYHNWNKILFKTMKPCYFKIVLQGQGELRLSFNKRIDMSEKQVALTLLKLEPPFSGARATMANM